MPSMYSFCSLIARRRRRSWQDERPLCDDEFFAQFDKSRPGNLGLAATDAKHTLGRSLASSLQDDLYIALAHDFRDKVTGL
jgi:hypothetical protein